MRRMMTRREAVAALAGTATLPLLAGCRQDPTPVTTPDAADAEALATLDSIAENFLRLFPESATSLGIDTGAQRRLSLAAPRPLTRRQGAGGRTGARRP
jgi:hypothetical protein